MSQLGSFAPFLKGVQGVFLPLGAFEMTQTVWPLFNSGAFSSVLIILRAL